jgi:hypothetical protein
MVRAPLESGRDANKRIDPIRRRRHTNVHARVQLEVLIQLVGKARSEDNRITA